jgi:alkylation response protein AidB-like acyl-CoA dehydrogenase
MDLSLNETQLMLQSMAREFAEREAPKRIVREIDESETGFSADLWRKIADLGLPGMALPEVFGGTGNSLTDLAAVFEVLGQNATPSPLLSQVLCAHLVLDVGTPAQHDVLLPAIASGERLAAFAFTEHDYGWTANAVNLRAVVSGGQATLTGTKVFVPYAHVCDDLYVLARSNAGLTLVRVDGSAATTRRQSGWLGEPVCEVTLDGVTGDVIGADGGAWAGVGSAIDKSVVLLTAYMLGGGQAALDLAIEYSKTRMAFGQAIGTFQRVQDLIIKVLNDVDSIRWTTYEALWKLDEGRADASLAASMAKAVASNSFQSATESSLYVHAGAGMDLDYGLTNHIKRSKFYGHYLGDANHHKLRMARLLELT